MPSLLSGKRVWHFLSRYCFAKGLSAVKACEWPRPSRRFGVFVCRWPRLVGGQGLSVAKACQWTSVLVWSWLWLLTRQAVQLDGLLAMGASF